jgi:adenylate cyclase
MDRAVLDRAHGHALTARSLDPDNRWAQVLLSHVYLWTGRHDEAIAELEAAIAIDPGNGDLFRDLAEVLVFAGRPSEALELMDEAMQINPNFPVTYPFVVGFAHVVLGDHQAAITVLEPAVDLNPVFVGNHLLLAVAYAETGRTDAAERAVARIRDINPALTLEVLEARLPFADQAAMALLDVLAGLGMD